jgi:hypothetical protein
MSKKHTFNFLQENQPKIIDPIRGFSQFIDDEKKSKVQEDPFSDSDEEKSNEKIEESSLFLYQVLGKQGWFCRDNSISSMENIPINFFGKSQLLTLVVTSGDEVIPTGKVFFVKNSSSTEIPTLQNRNVIALLNIKKPQKKIFIEAGKSTQEVSWKFRDNKFNKKDTLALYSEENFQNIFFEILVKNSF